MAKKVDDKINYDNFKAYLESRVIYNGIADSITVSEPKDKEKDILFTIDCDGYITEVTCEDLMYIDIDYKFLYPGCDTKFSLEDVFNVLNIDDFDDYGYTADKDDEKSQEKAIDDLLSVIKKYDYDIRKAGSEDYLKDMEKMHNADEKVYNSDELKIITIIKFTKLITKMQSKKDEKSKQKFLKEAKKLEERNLLTTSQWRYKNYIEQGYPIPDNANDNVNKNYSDYAKKAFLAYAICFISGIIICFLIFFADRAIISREGIFVNDNISYFIALVAGGFTGYLLSRIFGTKIITALSKEEQKEYMKKERLQRYDSEGIIKKIWSKYVIFAVSLIAAPIIMLVACSGVCFSDNAITDHSLFINTQVKYDEAEIFLVKGWYDDENNYSEYESPCYRISYEGESQMETGEIKDKDKAQKIEQLLKEKNIEVKEVKN